MKVGVTLGLLLLVEKKECAETHLLINNSRRNYDNSLPTLRVDLKAISVENKEIMSETLHDGGKPVVALRSRTNSIFANKDKNDWMPSYGDIVWVQTHSTFPFWPACVMDPAMLPVETQAMATAALSRASSTSSTIAGRDLKSSKKRALYMFASAHYDFATAQQVRFFCDQWYRMLVFY